MLKCLKVISSKHRITEMDLICLNEKRADKLHLDLQRLRERSLPAELGMIRTGRGD